MDEKQFMIEMTLAVTQLLELLHKKANAIPRIPNESDITGELEGVAMQYLTFLLTIETHPGK